MTLRRALSLAALACAVAIPAPSQATRAHPESLFVAGWFQAADSAYGARLRGSPRDTMALLRTGMLALWSNRLDQARDRLRRALRQGAEPKRVAGLIGETFYRADRFDSAAVYAHLAGREPEALKLESFRGRLPYRIAAPARVSVPFVQTDPLPLVEITLNGRGPFLVLIDTGGGELIVDPVFADSVGARRYGSETGLFGGGRQRAIEHGSLDSVRIGAATIHDVPINVLDTSRFSGAAGGRRVAGILGTTLLSRFVFTIDYPAAALILEPRRGGAASTSAAAPSTQAGAGGTASATAGSMVVPFQLAGDHLILARGMLAGRGPFTWFVDTGLAGAGFTAPASTLIDAGMVLADTVAFQGQGGGGGVRVVPFRVPRLTLGNLERSDLMGMLGPFPEPLEYRHGTRIAGIVSHAFFRASRVIFDFDRMAIRIEPSP